MKLSELQALIRREILSVLDHEPPRRQLSGLIKGTDSEFPNGVRRRQTPMCAACLDGNHSGCTSFRCPCVCNDEAYEHALGVA
jgi:hypothetical protein